MDFTKELQLIRRISISKEYWFVRTQGGDYYDEFVKGGYIAIGYDKILLSDLDESKNMPNPTDFLGKKIRKYYPENKRPTHTANQLIGFAYGIKEGDIVLSPSSSSAFIKFGKVVETPVYIKSDSRDNDECPFEKRKRVIWFNALRKEQLDPNLYKLIYSHQTLTNASGYAEYIDKSLYSFFVKGDRAHLVVNVKTVKGVNAKDLFRLGLDLFAIVDSFGEKEKINVNSDDVEAKANFNSPGTIEFISYSITTLMIIGAIIVLLNGGEFELNLRFAKINLKSEGLLRKVTDFLNEKENRKIKGEITRQLKNLQIKSPEDIQELFKALNQGEDEKNQQ